MESNEWVFREDQERLFPSEHSAWVREKIHSVVHDPAVWRRMRRMDDNGPAPGVVRFLGWQGNLDYEPMLFLFLHTWGWLQRRLLLVSLRHRTIAQRCGNPLGPRTLTDLLRDFRTLDNRRLFTGTVPSPYTVGLVARSHHAATTTPRKERNDDSGVVSPAVDDLAVVSDPAAGNRGERPAVCARPAGAGPGDVLR